MIEINTSGKGIAPVATVIMMVIITLLLFAILVYMVTDLPSDHEELGFVIHNHTNETIEITLIVRISNATIVSNESYVIEPHKNFETDWMRVDEENYSVEVICCNNSKWSPFQKGELWLCPTIDVYDNYLSITQQEEKR